MFRALAYLEGIFFKVLTSIYHKGIGICHRDIKP